MKLVKDLDVVGSMTLELRAMRRFNQWRLRLKREHRYSTFLRQAAPGIHPGFFEKSLDLLIRKS